MSIYCFLRHQGNFYRAVESVIRLGGDTSSTGALVGGLAGANLGIKQIPQSLVDRLSNTGYGPEWIADMAHRLSEWPHGSDDLIAGPPQPTHPLSVLGGNIYRHLIRVWRSLKRLGNPRRRDRGFRA